MRRSMTILLTVVISVVALGASQAWAADEARQVVERAIDALGGRELLDKYPVGTINVAGTMSMDGVMIPYTGTEAWALPERFAVELNMNVMGRKMHTIQTIIDGKIAQTVNGRSVALPESLKKEIRGMAKHREIDQLTPLLDSDRYQLTLEPDATVGDFQTSVVGVTSADVSGVKLFFDKKKGLPIKSQHTSVDESGKTVLSEAICSDYQRQYGMLMSMRQTVTQNGHPHMTIKISNVKLFEKLDDKALARGN